MKINKNVKFGYFKDRGLGRRSVISTTQYITRYIDKKLRILFPVGGQGAVATQGPERSEDPYKKNAPILYTGGITCLKYQPRICSRLIFEPRISTLNMFELDIRASNINLEFINPEPPVTYIS